MDIIKYTWQEYITTLFPDGSEFFLHQSESFRLEVKWPLNNDPERSHKSSKSIYIVIPPETIGDYMVSELPLRERFDRNLLIFIIDKLGKFNPEHDAPRHRPPPAEYWPVMFGIKN